MTRGRSDATLRGSAGGFPSWKLHPRPDGGFTIDGPDRVEARAEKVGFAVRGDLFEPGVRLLPDGRGRGIFLTDGAGNERDTVSTLIGGSIAEDPPSVTLSDGRVFRLVCAPAGYALLGRDHPGAYLEVVPEGSGWRFDVTPAGNEMNGLHRLLVLVASAIVKDRASPGMEGMDR